MVSPRTSARCRLVVLASLCVVAGCNRGYSGDRRHSLSGTVRVDGQPMDVGVISFIPADTDKQRVSGGPITEGRYSVEEASGANDGTYRVEIRWYRKTGRLVKDPLTGDLIEERKEGLPKHYHKESKRTVEVSSGRTTFDFDLKSQ